MKTKPVSAKPAVRTKASPPPSPKPVQTWSGRLQIQVSPAVVEFLYYQGARPDRGRSTFSLSNVMRRQCDLLVAVIEESDPRKSRLPFPQEYYDLTIEVLAHPWTLNADIIRLLDAYVAHEELLPSLLKQRGIQPAAYLQAIAGLAFAERLHLVEKALVRHAPILPKLPSRRRR